MHAVLRTMLLSLVLAGLGGPVAAQSQPPPAQQYPSKRIDHDRPPVFGTVSRGLAQIIEKAGSQWGQPNGYILGQEASGAFMAGLRYGEGMLYTQQCRRPAGVLAGPLARVRLRRRRRPLDDADLHLPATEAIYQRFVGIDGSAYFVGGFGMTALTASNIVVVPIRTGVGLRLGANIGYLNFTRGSTWNPF